MNIREFLVYFVLKLKNLMIVGIHIRASKFIEMINSFYFVVNLSYLR